jgi:hypothetical protein
MPDMWQGCFGWTQPEVLLMQLKHCVLHLCAHLVEEDSR